MGDENTGDRLVSNFKCDLIFSKKDPWEAELYGVLVYEFRKIDKQNDLSDPFRKIIIHFKGTRYKMTVIVCLTDGMLGG